MYTAILCGKRVCRTAHLNDKWRRFSRVLVKGLLLQIDLCEFFVSESGKNLDSPQGVQIENFMTTGGLIKQVTGISFPDGY